ncbi:MAG: undecaprenyl-diphosphate phosphatase, partial [Oscillospiraceae bacterium]|nr:undecaprenyl-diphosphate phosphatase [Oscillospiraceae bacterium]
ILIQAFIQGLTEFLPVSSSGHLSVAQHFMNIEEGGLTVSIFLHMGTLLAIIIAFKEAVWGMIREFFLSLADIFTLRFSWKNMNEERRMLFMVVIATALLIPAILFKGFFVAPMSDGDIIFEGCAFIFTAVILFMADSCTKGIKTTGEMQVKDALTVGFFQIIALFPGVSRSGSTISSGLFCGLSRKTAVTFSFMLGIPAIAGASLLEIRELTQGVQSGEIVAGNINWIIMGLGFIVSLVVGLFAIKLVKLLIKKEKFKIFAIYVLTLGILCVAWGVFENLTGIKIRLS